MAAGPLGPRVEPESQQARATAAGAILGTKSGRPKGLVQTDNLQRRSRTYAEELDTTSTKKFMFQTAER